MGLGEKALQEPPNQRSLKGYPPLVFPCGLSCRSSWFLRSGIDGLFLPWCCVAGGVPRTPVRQKMNAMCRSLKMVNVARLNVKAQKLHPDDSPEVPGDKGVPRVSGGKAADKLEDRGRTLRSSKPKGMPPFCTLCCLLFYALRVFKCVWSCPLIDILDICLMLWSILVLDLEFNCRDETDLTEVVFIRTTHLKEEMCALHDNKE